MQEKIHNKRTLMQKKQEYLHHLNLEAPTPQNGQTHSDSVFDHFLRFLLRVKKYKRTNRSEIFIIFSSLKFNVQSWL